jgi:hypothetical protein
MRFKRHRYSLASNRSRPPHNFTQHVRVRAVNSIKITDGK